MSLRLFIAIPADKASILPFQAFRHTVHTYPDGFRWIEEGNWHATVLFLGKVDESKLGSVNETLQNHLASLAPFTIGFDKYELRFRNKRPSMVWARYQTKELLDELVKGIHKDVSKIVELEPLRPQFIPHITLARIRRSGDKASVRWENPPLPPDLPVRQFILYQSQLSAEGATYTPLFRHQLKLPPVPPRQ